MIFSENRLPLFGIMLFQMRRANIRAKHMSAPIQMTMMNTAAVMVASGQ